jgi:D-beta-D-heptose 7-phosphate kinase/D-beta-D-heptose 1-phosphate adenosyltransferase
MSDPVRDALPGLKRLLSKLKGQRIGVLGDLMLDRYLSGDATKLSPEVPVPVVNFKEQKDCLGGAANVAANLAALDARVEVFGVVGEDEPGEVLRAGLHNAGIGAHGVLADKSRITTVKARVIARQHQIVRLDYERRDQISPVVEDQLFRQILKSLAKLAGLILSDYDKGVLMSDTFADRVLNAAHKAEVPVFVKPKTTRLYAYRGARVIACNKKEAEFFLTRPLSGENSFLEAAQSLLAQFGCAAVVITRGGDGMSVLEEQSQKQLFTIPATSFEVTYARVGERGVERGSSGRQVFDVTGAGDTVLSVLTLAVAAGAPVRDAAMLANIAAGEVVGKLGTATISVADLAAGLENLRR